jgi:hypothetical protein
MDLLRALGSRDRHLDCHRLIGTPRGSRCVGLFAIGLRCAGGPRAGGSAGDA